LSGSGNSTVADNSLLPILTWGAAARAVLAGITGACGAGVDACCAAC